MTRSNVLEHTARAPASAHSEPNRCTPPTGEFKGIFMFMILAAFCVLSVDAERAPWI